MAQKPESKTLGPQLRSPHGPMANEVGLFMERINVELYTFCLEHNPPAESEKVLEIGPGNGAFCSQYFLQTKDLVYTGVEMSQEMYEECLVRNKTFVECGRAKFFKGDILNLQLNDNTYDAIYGVNVIYFLNPVLDYLNLFHRILKPGGRLSFGLRDGRTMKNLPFVDDHFNLYEAEEIVNILRKAGFEHVEYQTAPETIKTLEGQIMTLTNVSTLAFKGKMA